MKNASMQICFPEAKFGMSLIDIKVICSSLVLIKRYCSEGIGIVVRKTYFEVR